MFMTRRKGEGQLKDTGRRRLRCDETVPLVARSGVDSLGASPGINNLSIVTEPIHRSSRTNT